MSHKNKHRSVQRLRLLRSSEAVDAADVAECVSLAEAEEDAAAASALWVLAGDLAFLCDDVGRPPAYFYETATRVFDSNSEAWEMLAYQLDIDGRPASQVLDAFYKAISLGASADCYVHLSEKLQEIGLPEDSIAVVRSGLKVFPDDNRLKRQTKHL